MTNHPAMLLIDASAIAYAVETMAVRSRDPDQTRETLLLWVDQRLFLTSGFECCVLWLLDSPPYWRSIYQPTYKAQRAPSEVKIGKSLEIIKTFHYAAITGYEADDLAGAIVRSLPEMHHYLLTSDSDWGGLVSERVTMLSPWYSPHVRQTAHVWNWLEKQHRELPKCRAWQYQLPSITEFDPRAVWEFKSIFGDSGDNLPPGSNRGLIDLLEPLSDPLAKPELEGQLWQAIMRALDNPVAFSQSTAQQVAQGCSELLFNPIRIGREMV